MATRSLCRLNRTAFLLPAALAALAPAPAIAHELWAGIYVHDVKTVLSLSGIEVGAAIQLGWRGDPIAALGPIGGPSPHAYASLSTEGNTNFAVAGLGWRTGDTVYVRPGIGLAVHNGPGRRVPGDGRIDFGSRILFAPELAVGVRTSERLSIEASWVHLSHAQLFSRQNPGLDNIGVRLTYRLR